MQTALYEVSLTDENLEKSGSDLTHDAAYEQLLTRRNWNNQEIEQWGNFMQRLLQFTAYARSPKRVSPDEIEQLCAKARNWIAQLRKGRRW